jgi:hypothetical protein
MDPDGPRDLPRELQRPGASERWPAISPLGRRGGHVHSAGHPPDLSPARTIASSARMPTAGFCLRSAYRSRSDAGGALDSFRLA